VFHCKIVQISVKIRRDLVFLTQAHIAFLETEKIFKFELFSEIKFLRLLIAGMVKIVLRNKKTQKLKK
jgi:hypothetical protein